MPYAKLLCHAVWATKNREPLIDTTREAMIQTALRDTCTAMGVFCYSTGIVADHAHVVLSIPPKLAVAEVIGRLKGVSSHAVRSHQNQGPIFSWQGEYGVLSLTEKALPFVISYVTNQHERHANNELLLTLERIT